MTATVCTTSFATAKNIFIPHGGGVRTIADVRDMLSWCHKVAINTAAVKRPELVAEASRSLVLHNRRQ